MAGLRAIDARLAAARYLSGAPDEFVRLVDLWGALDEPLRLVSRGIGLSAFEQRIRCDWFDFGRSENGTTIVSISSAMVERLRKGGKIR